MNNSVLCYFCIHSCYHVQDTKKGNYLAHPMLVQCIITEISTVKITYDIQEPLERSHVSYTTENMVKTKKELNVF